MPGIPAPARPPAHRASTDKVGEGYDRSGWNGYPTWVATGISRIRLLCLLEQHPGIELMKEGCLTIDRANLDGQRRLNLRGELDLNTTPAVRAALSKGQTDGKNIVVDTTGVTFIDSTGLATLVAARQRMGERFTLIPGRATLRLLELSGALDHFGLDP